VQRGYGPVAAFLGLALAEEVGQRTVHNHRDEGMEVGSLRVVVLETLQKPHQEFLFDILLILGGDAGLPDDLSSFTPDEVADEGVERRVDVVAGHEDRSSGRAETGRGPRRRVGKQAGRGTVPVRGTPSASPTTTPLVRPVS
jgi:hypothetical protein